MTSTGKRPLPYVFLAIWLTTIGCGGDPDPAVGQWYGKVDDPAAAAAEMVEKWDGPPGERPTVDFVFQRLDEARYQMKLNADGTGLFDDTACRWKRKGTQIVVEIGATADGQEVIRLAFDGKYLRGDGYIFAPWRR